MISSFLVLFAVIGIPMWIFRAWDNHSDDKKRKRELAHYEANYVWNGLGPSPNARWNSDIQNWCEPTYEQLQREQQERRHKETLKTIDGVNSQVWWIGAMIIIVLFYLFR